MGKMRSAVGAGDLVIPARWAPVAHRSDCIWVWPVHRESCFWASAFPLLTLTFPKGSGHLHLLCDCFGFPK